MQILDPKKYATYMLDIETNGLSTVKNSITSFCFVHFNPAFYSQSTYLHARFNDTLEGRVADPETLQWRVENYVNDMEESIQASGTIKENLALITKFIDQDIRIPVLFCNHTNFDNAFLKGYFDTLNLLYPFKYNLIYDVDSIIIGARLCPKKARQALAETNLWKNTKSALVKHNPNVRMHDAYYDCVWQIKLLQLAMARPAPV